MLYSEIGNTQIFSHEIRAQQIVVGLLRRLRSYCLHLGDYICLAAMLKKVDVLSIKILRAENLLLANHLPIPVECYSCYPLGNGIAVNYRLGCQYMS